MKNLAGVWLACLAVVVSAAACSDSGSKSPGGPQGGSGAGETSHAGEAPASSAGASMTGEGGGATSEGGATSIAGGAASAGDAGAGGGPLASASDYCEAFGDALCTWRETCAQSADCLTWGGYLRFMQECEDAIASESEGLVTFVPEGAAACVEAVNQASVECSAGPPFNDPRVQAGCRSVFAGTVESGDVCSKADFANVFDECAEGYCVREAGECLGSCASYLQEDEACSLGEVCQPGLHCNQGSCGPPRTLGEPCSSAVCETGLNCAGEPATCRSQGVAGDDCVDRYDCRYPASCIDDKCAVDVAVGEPCQTSESCADALYCNASLAVPVCATRLAPAAPCQAFNDSCVADYGCSLVEPYVCVEAVGGLNEACGPSGCEADLWCDYSAPYTGTCRARVPLNGECEGDVACVVGLFCSGPEPAKCQPPGAVGEPCSAFEPQSCLAELFCARDTVTCAAPRAVGQSCNPAVPEASCEGDLFCACLSSECPNITSSHQAEDVCAAQVANGQECTFSYECLSGYCLESECAPAPVAAPNCTR